VSPGPIRILACVGGTWCYDCHRDLDDGTDRDPDLYVNKRLLDGKCDCCNEEVRNGEYA
jgi:hypothetical protein